MIPDPRLPPGQAWAAKSKWPFVGEREPDHSLSGNTLEVTGCLASPRTFTLNQLASFPSTTSTLDIHCVTRWSQKSLTFRGVLLSDLLRELEPTSSARFVSYIARSARRHSTSMPLADAMQLGTLLATHVDDQPLSTEHGGPLRVITPGRYFYKSLKWLMKIELLEEDRLGYWEAEAGYHNVADPWQEQRYVSSSLSREQAMKLAHSRDLSTMQLLSLDLSGHQLSDLCAERAILRNSNFDRCDLSRASFTCANLSNASLVRAALCDANFRDADLEGANFIGADLRGADLRGASLLGCTFVDPAGEQHTALDRTTIFSSSALTMLAPSEAAYIESLASFR